MNYDSEKQMTQEKDLPESVVKECRNFDEDQPHSRTRSDAGYFGSTERTRQAKEKTMTDAERVV